MIIKLATSADWSVLIPPTLTDKLSFEDKESLIELLHLDGASEIFDYNGVAVVYTYTDESTAYDTCLSTLNSFFAGIAFEKETN